MELKDLEFKNKGNAMYDMGRRAVVEFDNNYGLSIITGKGSYTSFSKPYEVAILFNGEMCYSTVFTDVVLTEQTESDVNNLIKKVSKL